MSDIVFGVFFSDLGGFGSVVAVFTAAVESCDTLSALLIEIMVDLYVDLPLDLTVVGALGLLEAAFATVFSAVGFFVVTVVLSELGDSENGVVEGVVGEYDIVLSRFAFFVVGLEGPVIALFSLSVDCEVVSPFSFVGSLLAGSVVSLDGSFDFKLPFFFNLSRVKQN